MTVCNSFFNTTSNFYVRFHPPKENVNGNRNC